MEIKQTDKGIVINDKISLPAGYSPSKGEVDKIGFLYDRRSKSQIVYDNNKENWSKNIALYEANTVDGGIYSYCQTKQAEEITNSPKAQINAVHKKDTKYAPLVHAIIVNEWKKSKSDSELFKANLSKIILGTGLISTTWEKIVRPVYKATGLDKTGKPKYEQVDVLEYEGIKNKYVDLRNFYPSLDKRVSSIEELDDYFIRVDVTRDQWDIEYKNNPKYKNTEYVSAEGSDQQYIEQNREEQTTAVQDWDKFHLWFYYNKPKDWMVIMTSNNVIIFEGHLPPHKQLPISLLVNHYQLNSLYGRAEPDLLQATSQYEEELLNTLMFTAKLAACPPTIVDETLSSPDYPELDFEWANAAIWRVNDVDKIKFAQIAAVNPDSYRVSDMIDKKRTFVTGINPYQTMSQPGNETAYEKQRQRESQMTRIRVDQAFNDGGGIQRVFDQMLALVKEYYPEVRKDSMYKDTSERGYKVVRADDISISRTPRGTVKEVAMTKGVTQYFEVTPDILEKEYECTVIPNSTLVDSKPLRQAQKNEVMTQLLNAANTPAGAKVNWDGVLQWWMEDLGIDKGRLFNDDIQETPDDENYRFLEGEVPQISEKDDDDVHMISHAAFLKVVNQAKETSSNLYQNVPEATRRLKLAKLEVASANLEKHIKGHITRKQEKEMAKQNEMMQQVAGKPSSVAPGQPSPPAPSNPTVSNMLGASVNSNNIGK